MVATSNRNVLYDPVLGFRRQAEWDDHGEVKNDAAETPQYLFMRIAMGLSFNEKDPTLWAKRFYQKMSQMKYIAGGSTNLGAGTTRPSSKTARHFESARERRRKKVDAKNIAGSCGAKSLDAGSFSVDRPHLYFNAGDVDGAYGGLHRPALFVESKKWQKHLSCLFAANASGKKS